MTRTGLFPLAMVSIACLTAIAGCTPAAVTSAAKTAKAGSRTSNSSDWSRLITAVTNSEATRDYRAVCHVHWLHEDSAHSVTETVVVRGQRMLMTVSADGIGYQYYQTKSQAYVDHAGNWTRTVPLSSINLFKAYADLLKKAEQKHIPMRTLPQKSLGGEKNAVDQLTIPASWLQDQVQPLATGSTASQQSPTVLTLFIGNRSHRLRFVETSGTDAAGVAGIADITTNIEFYYDAAHTKLRVPHLNNQ